MAGHGRVVQRIAIVPEPSVCLTSEGNTQLALAVSHVCVLIVFIET